jgi:hypothetical protein
MKMAAYQLNEYRINSGENGLLWWETHHGFGTQRRGMCFMYHDTLILGPCSHEEIGYLKGEYLDRLEKLPPWSKTKHYCFASELLDVVSGLSLDRNFMDWVYSSVSIGSHGAGPILDGDPGTFRLDKYQITVAPNGDMTWQACGRMNRVLSGPSSIQSGVLFIAAEEQEKERASKEDFFKKLDTMPQWDRTRVWSRCLVLRPCHPFQQEAKPPVARHKDVREWGSDQAEEKHPLMDKQQLRDRVRRSLPSRVKSCKLSWSRSPLSLAFRFEKPLGRLLRKVTFWSTSLILMVIARLLAVLTRTLHSVKERLHRIQFSIKHHHKGKGRGIK